jgi:hypothetical protein
MERERERERERESMLLLQKNPSMNNEEEASILRRTCVKNRRAHNLNLSECMSD